jgi:hypothetical protein
LATNKGSITQKKSKKQQIVVEKPYFKDLICNKNKVMKKLLLHPLMLLLLSATTLINLSSCSKEEPEPTNNVGRIIFWQGKANADDNVDLGITSLKFYVAGELVGSMAADLYWNVAPDCGNTSAVNVNWQLGTKTSQTVTYEIKDQDNEVIYTGSITVYKDQCKQFEMTP